MQMSRLASTGAAVHSVEVTWTFCTRWMTMTLFVELETTMEMEEEKRDLASPNSILEEKTEA